MKKSILILILAGLLTACSAEKSETSINVENTTSAVSETESPTNPTTQIKTKTTVTTVSTTVTTTKITTAFAETTVSAEKKKTTTTAKKNSEETAAPEVYEEIDEYNTAEVQYQNNEHQEAEPQKEEITPPPTEPPESSGISQSEINGYIIQSAANYGMAGASVTSGDIWSGGYSFNSPINTAVNDSVYAVESYADSELGRIYSECLNSGMTPEEIAQYLYVYVCWDGEWLYIMW